jgi:hypothetical protein
LIKRRNLPDAAMIVTIVTMIVVFFIWPIVNTIALASAGRTPARESTRDRFWMKYYGNLDMPVPQWLIVLLAVITGTYLALRWLRKRWSVPEVHPGIVVLIVSMFGASNATTASNLYTANDEFNLYHLAAALWIAIGFLAIVNIRMRHERGATPARRVTAPEHSTRARLLLAMVVVATVALGLAGPIALLAGATILWLTGDTPVRESIYIAPSVSYAGHMPFTVPWWAFTITPTLIVAASALGWRPERWPDGPSTGGLPLPVSALIVSAASTLSSLICSPFYVAGNGIGSWGIYQVGVIVNFTVLIAVGLWVHAAFFVNPGPRIKRGKSASRR